MENEIIIWDSYCGGLLPSDEWENFLDWMGEKHSESGEFIDSEIAGHCFLLQSFYQMAHDSGIWMDEWLSDNCENSILANAWEFIHQEGGDGFLLRLDAGLLFGIIPNIGNLEIGIYSRIFNALNAWKGTGIPFGKWNPREEAMLEYKFLFIGNIYFDSDDSIIEIEIGKKED